MPPSQLPYSYTVTKSTSPMNKTRRPKTLVRSVVNLIEFEDLLDNIEDDWNAMLNASNGVSITQISYKPVYKYYVGKGNNKS